MFEIALAGLTYGLQYTCEVLFDQRRIVIGYLLLFTRTAVYAGFYFGRQMGEEMTGKYPTAEPWALIGVAELFRPGAGGPFDFVVDFWSDVEGRDALAYTAVGFAGFGDLLEDVHVEGDVEFAAGGD